MEMIERREEYSSFIKSLPNDVMMDILSRLPVKSLVRFECVSKSWLALLTDPYFAKMHLNRSYERKNNKNEKQFVFSRVSKERATIVVFSGEFVDPMWPSGKVDYPPLDFDFVCQWGARFLGCCDGLILYSPYSYTSAELHLVNPSTRKLKRLHPPFKCEPHGGSYGFDYDALTDDYKVVHIPSYVGKTCITTLYTRKTNSWRRIQDIPYHVKCSAPAALLNGALHWLTEDMSKIVSLDLAEEKFQVFILPEFGTKCEEAYLVTVVGVCLCVCVTIRGQWVRSSEFWVMKEYGKRESWTNLGFAIPKYQVKPLDFSNNHNLLSIVERSLLVSNVGRNEHYFVEIGYDFPHLEVRSLGLPESYYLRTSWEYDTLIRVDDAQNFLESIVSPVIIPH